MKGRPSQDPGFAELIENFHAMLVGDVLAWDVINLRSTYDSLRVRAKKLGWRITQRCNPPLPAGLKGYTVTAGRLTIKRIA